MRHAPGALRQYNDNLGNAAMEKFKQFLWFQGPALAWATAIFIQSSMSYINTPDLGFDWQDKLLHAIEYAILGFLLRRALAFQDNRFLREHVNWATILIGSSYAISDEIHQFYVPGRSSDLSDVIADVVGITVVIMIYVIGRQLKQWRRPRSVTSV